MKALAGLGVIALILLIIALIIVGPLLTIWALNTLFGLGIGYTFKTWLAMFLLGLFFRGLRTSSSKE